MFYTTTKNYFRKKKDYNKTNYNNKVTQNVFSTACFIYHRGLIKIIGHLNDF